jgi:hypothetical protein
MSWAILPLCYAAKQYQLYGHLSNSLLVSVALMEVGGPGAANGKLGVLCLHSSWEG